MARNKTKAYPESFRKEAVRLADLPDRSATRVANKLGINVSQFKRLTEKQFIPWMMLIIPKTKVKNSVNSDEKINNSERSVTS
ncbi:MAG: hypothetical protein V3U78_07345 [Thiotrichaceae bacterium]